MPQHERGLYEPGEDVGVFDGSEEEEDVEGSRLPLLIVLALLVLAMFAGFVWLAYSEGVARGRGETPVVTAEAGPARAAPQDAGGGAAEPYKGFKVYEQPAPPDDDTAQNSATAQHAAPDAKAAAASASVPPAAKAEVPSAPAKIASAVPATKPSLAAKSTPAPSQPSVPIGPATAPPKPLAAAPPATPVASAPSAASAAPQAGGSYVLQIGAYKSQADADTAWTTYKTKHASLLAGYSPDVRQADLGEKGVWYRLRIAGFPSKDVASALCDRLKADGGGCFLGK
jgi:cell division protein FtsN